MCRQSIHLISLVATLLLLAGGTAFGQFSADSDASLVALWRLNDAAGTTATDDSPNGNNGALQGDPEWTPGVLEGALAFDGDGDYVDCGNDAVFDITEQITLAIWVNANDMLNGEHNCWLGKGDNAYAIKHQSGNNLEFFIYSGDWYSTNYTTDLDTLIGEWHHMTGTFDGDELLFYLDGEVAETLAFSGAISTATHNVTLGENSQATGRYFDGMLDDARIYNRALTQEEILIVMLGGTTPELASDPSPESEATDVPRDKDLSWTPGESAVSHDVYFGTAMADVEAGDASVLVSQGQTGTTYDPGRLEFGQTYYWRIDAVGGPDGTVEGDIWSFTAEPLAYAIENVTVTANTTSDTGAEPENMINGSGLNDAGQHSVDAPDMWLGVPGADLPTLAFEFDQAYKLNEMVVWNYNVMFEPMLGFGLKDVTVEYSADGSDWIVLGDVVFAQAAARTDYEANTTVDFGGVAVKAVRLTVNSGYGTLGQFGLSEIRFMYIPAQAREPQPVDGKTNVAPDAVLGWRAGREAAVHEVLVSASGEAVLDGTAVVDSISETTYPLASLGLEFGTSYYWKVNEVNDAEAISAWEGNIWSFAIEDYATVDDFESYTDDDGGRIYETWLDGWVNDTGSTVGYLSEPFAEQAVVNGGRQSMPLQYDNSAAPFYAETERVFTGAAWNTNGADRLVVNYRGYPQSFVEGADGTFTIGAGGADIWGTTDEFRFVYKQLNGDGSITARVDSLDNSDPWAKAGVMIRESLTGNSAHGMTVVSAASGGSFQRRTIGGGDSTSSDAAGLAAPHWVRVTRTDDVITAHESADGVTWVEIANATPVEVAMVGSVYIGLAVTSHNANQMTSANFSNISTTGAVTGQWQAMAIGVDQPSNSSEQLYVAVEDSAGHVAVVVNPDPAATLATAWQEWEIPFTDLAGVNLGNVKTLYIGIGDRNAPSAGGTGMVFVDDIGYGRPASASADVTAAGDAVQGVPNDGDWPGAETPDLAIDDDVNTKFLHFKGATEPTGFQVTPAVGSTVVTGLTLTTANDAVERDPITFELYGSKDSIDGPYTLIASGDIVDFAGATAWERFTMTTTEISFENLMSYAHYQVLFPTVRDAGSANSMQIAEVELIGTLAP
jgi:concanavalin A-like lectin/glucanase superfamily protein